MTFTDRLGAEIKLGDEVIHFNAYRSATHFVVHAFTEHNVGTYSCKSKGNTKYPDYKLDGKPRVEWFSPCDIVVLKREDGSHPVRSHKPRNNRHLYT